MSSSETICIVGTGLAGGSAAPALREARFMGRGILVGAEGELPYDRPPLSKAYLTGKMPLEKLWLRPSAYYQQHAIELRTAAAATVLDPGASEVTLASGERIGYDRLLLATGAQPRHLSVPGAALAGVNVAPSYGMTEACHQMASNPLPPGERRPGSVGLSTGVEVAVVDDEWHQLSSGQPGEVVVRGPNVISAYAKYGRRTRTAVAGAISHRAPTDRLILKPARLMPAPMT